MIHDDVHFIGDVFIFWAIVCLFLLREGLWFAPTFVGFWFAALDLRCLDIESEWTLWIVMAQMIVVGFGGLFLRDLVKKKKWFEPPPKVVQDRGG